MLLFGLAIKTRLDNAMWDYDVPEVTSVTPDHRRTFGDCKLTIKGRNFGHEQESISR